MLITLLIALMIVVGGVECKVVGNVKYGDHTVFVGEVSSAYLNNDVDSLNLSSTGWNYGG